MIQTKYPLRLLRNLYHITLVSAIVSVVAIWPAYAEPSGLVAKLMNTEVSLFHYGMDRVREMASRYTKDKAGVYSSVKYDWDKNTILINFSVMRSSCKGPSECSEVGKSSIDEFIQTACFTSKDSRNQCDVVDVLSNEFAPTGFDIKSFYSGKSSGEAIKDLRYVFEVSAYVVGGDRKITSCRRKYAEKDTYCSTDNR